MGGCMKFVDYLISVICPALHIISKPYCSHAHYAIVTIAIILPCLKPLFHGDCGCIMSHCPMLKHSYDALLPLTRLVQYFEGCLLPLVKISLAFKTEIVPFPIHLKLRFYPWFDSLMVLWRWEYWLGVKTYILILLSLHSYQHTHCQKLDQRYVRDRVRIWAGVG